ncbi:4-(cytidine 5'-diphospho)-2-C-methyl-D-erythritol kinase [Elusimicrobiota bacterium]
MEINAPAKINLFLNVGKKREDTFHEISSIMIKVNLFDRITIEEADEIIIEAPEWLPTEENIVFKAASMLKEYASVNNGCRIKLEKNIPPGRGLGGGSSDCANVLKALNNLWETGLGIEELEKIGKELGSDVNFFLYPGSCHVSGRGEIIKPLQEIVEGKYYIILVDPGMEISTEKVYDKYPGGNLTQPQELDKIIQNYTEGKWDRILTNDLEDIVLKEYPVLKNLKDRLINWGSQPLLSGSGSCIYALVNEEKTAKVISSIIDRDLEFKTWIVNIITGE